MCITDLTYNCMSNIIDAMEKVISAREMQRNYKKILDKTKRSKRPLYLGRNYKPEFVVLDLDSYEKLKGWWSSPQPRRTWEEIEKSLNWIAKGGRQNVNLAKFIHNDRQSH